MRSADTITVRVSKHCLQLRLPNLTSCAMFWCLSRLFDSVNVLILSQKPDFVKVLLSVSGCSPQQSHTLDTILTPRRTLWIDTQSGNLIRPAALSHHQNIMLTGL